MGIWHGDDECLEIDEMNELAPDFDYPGIKGKLKKMY